MKYTVLDEAACKSWKYPGGEVGVRALEVPPRILAHVQSSDDLLRLLLYLQATRLTFDGRVVFIPYLPYARQDRAAVAGDPDALDALARLLGTTTVREFVTLDVHSKHARDRFLEAGCMLTSLSPLPYLERYVDGLVRRERPLVLVAPDAGAREKVTEYALGLARPGGVSIICCAKKRASDTGALSGFEIVSAPDALPEHASVVVVDDICDGGGTFLGVAETLRAKYGGALQLHLFTSHGIYSKGLETLLAAYQSLGSTDSFLHGLSHPRLFTLPLEA